MRSTLSIRSLVRRALVRARALWRELFVVAALFGRRRCGRRPRSYAAKCKSAALGRWSMNYLLAQARKHDRRHLMRNYVFATHCLSCMKQFVCLTSVSPTDNCDQSVSMRWLTISSHLTMKL